MLSSTGTAGGSCLLPLLRFLTANGGAFQKFSSSAVDRISNQGRLLKRLPSCSAAGPGQLRKYSDDDHCEDKCAQKEEEKACGPAVLRAYPCGNKPEEPEKPKPKPPKTAHKSMWDIDGCEPDICVLPLRYDMKYYRISDKEKRKYQVTWNECPRLLVKPKKVCLYEKVVRPKIKRRKRCPPKPMVVPIAPDAACEKGKRTCPTISMPCCKSARKPPDCSVGFRGPAKCDKPLAPYPSFSECQKDPFEEPKPTECKCLNAAALCEAWAEMRRRIAMGKSTIPKCGEF
ncbi:CG2127 [Drosophila busckii]|uniref:CG2127 n=1 Tax=Drosophila busckii TaxID=30019 RepID=A0A0M4ETP4_DROBS|nr:uncharacterized protein LOC108596208 [Drosophila busckii]ALC40912.1 CG2127 [Drosophila busckii]